MCLFKYKLLRISFFFQSFLLRFLGQVIAEFYALKAVIVLSIEISSFCLFNGIRFREILLVNFLKVFVWSK